MSRAAREPSHGKRRRLRRVGVDVLRVLPDEVLHRRVRDADVLAILVHPRGGPIGLVDDRPG